MKIFPFHLLLQKCEHFYMLRLEIRFFLSVLLILDETLSDVNPSLSTDALSDSTEVQLISQAPLKPLQWTVQKDPCFLYLFGCLYI